MATVPSTGPYFMAFYFQSSILKTSWFPFASKPCVSSPTNAANVVNVGSTQRSKVLVVTVLVVTTGWHHRLTPQACSEITQTQEACLLRKLSPLAHTSLSWKILSSGSWMQAGLASQTCAQGPARGKTPATCSSRPVSSQLWTVQAPSSLYTLFCSREYDLNALLPPLSSERVRRLYFNPIEV